MNLNSAMTRAQKVGGPKGAAELYNEIEYELALGEPDATQEQNGERALATLRDRFPGVQEQARDVERPPSLSRTANRNASGEGRQRRQATTHAGGGGRGGHTGGRRHRTSSSTPRRAPAASSPRSSSSGPRASTSRSSSSGPGLGDLVPGFDATDSVLFVLRAILLLGVGYFLLSERGAKALGTVLSGVTSGVRLIVSPVDPLAGGLASSSTTSRAPAQATAQQVNTATGATQAPLTANAVNVATGAATGPLGSHVRQSTGPYGGGSTR